MIFNSYINNSFSLPPRCTNKHSMARSKVTRSCHVCMVSLGLGTVFSHLKATFGVGYCPKKFKPEWCPGARALWKPLSHEIIHFFPQQICIKWWGKRTVLFGFEKTREEPKSPPQTHEELWVKREWAFQFCSRGQELRLALGVVQRQHLGSMQRSQCFPIITATNW